MIGSSHTDPSATHFGPLKVAYDHRVLAPRPWTIAQSYWVSEAAAWAPEGRILELCSGVGHIGLAAAVLSHRALLQVDHSEVACAFARQNAARAGLEGSVEVRCGDLAAALDGEQFPIVIADPPYVPSSAVRAYPADPVGAIDGGDDGLHVIRQCLEVVARHLDPRGLLILQVSSAAQVRQATAIAAGLALLPTASRSIGGAGTLVGLRRRAEGG